MKSPLYISALFVLGLGLTGCGDSLTSPADNLDSLDGPAQMSKVLERNRMPLDDYFLVGMSDTDDSATTDSTTASDPFAPTSPDGGKK